MPSVVVGALISTAAAYITGQIVATALLGFFVRSLIAGALAYVVGKKSAPGKQPLPDRQAGIKRMVRLAAQPRRVIYGEQLVSGVVVYIGTTGSTNNYLHIVLALAGHEVEEIGDVWIGDRLSTDSKIANLVRVNKHLGAADQAADANLVGEVPEWTSDHRLQGIAYVYVRLQWDPDVWVSGIPNIKCMVRGKKVKDPRIPQGTPAWSNNWALCVRDYLTSSYGLGVPETDIDDTFTNAAANICEELVLYPNLKQVADQIDDQSTTTHSYVGLSYSKSAPDTTDYCFSVYLKQGTSGTSYITLYFSSGTPNYATLTITWGATPSVATSGDANNISGNFTSVGGGWYRFWIIAADANADNSTITARVWPATPTTAGTVIADGAQLTNTSTVVEYYPTNGTVGRADQNLLLYSDDFSQWSTVGTIVVTTDTGTCVAYHQQRYTCDGVIELNRTPADILDDLASAASGAITYVQGKYRIHAAAYDAPVASFDEGDLRDQLEAQPRASRKDLFNAVRGTFINPVRDWEVTDFPPITNSTYEAEDGGQRIYTDIELPFTTDVHRAQRLAKLLLERSRQALTVRFFAKLSALDVTVMDVVQVSIADMGWNNKEFRVLQWTLSEDGGVDMLLREEASAIYDWTYNDGKTEDPAPNTSLLDPSTVQPPSGLTLASGDNHLFVQSDGTIISRIYVTWNASPDPYLYRYDIEFKKSTDLVWYPATSTTKDVTEAYIAPVEDKVQYDVRVSAVNTLGVRSTWDIITGHTVIGKSSPPPDVDTFYVERQPDGTREFSWTYSNPPPDLAGFEIRYINGTGTYTWDQLTPLHEGLLQSSPYETNQLAAGQYVCAIKAVDTSGNYSTNAVFISSTLGDPRIGTALASVVEQPNWPYTKTNCRVEEDGYLWADNTTTWDTLPATWDEWTSWHFSAVSSFTYQHGQTDDTDAIDLGADVAVEPLTDYTLNDCTVVTEYAWRKEADTSYSAWTQNPGVITARYILVRATFTPTTALAHVRSMRTLVVADIKTDDITDLDTSTLTGSYRIGTGDVRLPITKSFQIIYVVNIALQNVGAGWSWELVDKDTSVGPRIRIYNASGVLADAVIDATVKGAI